MSQKFFTNLLIVSLLFAFPLFAHAKKNVSKHTNSASKNLFAAAPRQNEILVMGAVKSLYTAQATYFTTVGNRRFGALHQLWLANLIDIYLAMGEKYGYIFNIQTSLENGGIGSRFSVYAKPKNYGKSGKLSFYMDAGCTVRGGDKNGGDASVEDAVIDTCTPTLAYENERQIILAMRTLASSQETYKNTVGNGNYAMTFLDLYSAGLIDSWLSSGNYYNYDFNLNVNQPSPPFPGRFKFDSVPYPYGQMGFRSFYIDQNGVLRGADHQGGQPSENDPPIVENNEEK